MKKNIWVIRGLRIGFGLMIFQMIHLTSAHLANAASVTVCNSGCTYTTISAALAGVGSGNHTITVQSPYTTESTTAITVSNGGDSAALPLTIQAKFGDRIVVRGFSVNASNVTIKYFYVDTPSAGNSIELSPGRHNFVLENNTINAANYAAFNMQASGNWQENTRIINNTFTHGGKIFIDGNNTLVQGNLVDNNSNVGTASTSPCIAGHPTNTNCQDVFYVAGGENIVIRNNEVRNLVTDQNHEDIIVIYGNNYGARNVLIENNYFHDSDAQWADIENHQHPGTAYNITIRNNIIKNISASGNLDYPFTKVYNNIFDRVGYQFGNGAHSVSFMYTSTKGPCNNSELKNNIIISGFSTASAPYSLSPECGVVPDYNMATSSSFGTMTMSEPRGINGGNPLFINRASNDYRLQAASPVIGKGVAISPTFADSLGQARPAGVAWSIGPYEPTGGLSIQTYGGIPTFPSAIKIE